MTVTPTAVSGDTAVADHPPAPFDVLSVSGSRCTRQRVRRGESLFGAGDAFHTLYVVHAGVLKSFTVSEAGLIQITGFQIPRDVVGLDGIGTGQHLSAAVALEDSEVFVLPFARCEEWAKESPHGQRVLMQTLAREITRSQEQMVVLGATSAEQRVAAFLLDLSERYGRLGYSRSRFLLRMSRHDIGSYLGLQLETVSRVLSRLHREGLVQVQGRSIALLDLRALRRLTMRCPVPSASG